MGVYGIRNIEKLKKDYLKLFVPLVLMGVIVGIGMALIQMDDVKIALIVASSTIVFSGLTCFVTMKFTQKKYVAKISSIQYRTEDGHFYIDAKDTPSIHIAKENIVKITKYKDGWIEIKSTANPRTVIINKNVAESEQLITELCTLSPVIVLNKNRSNVLAHLSGIGSAGIAATFFVAANRTAVLISGIVFMVEMIVLFIYIVNAKYITKKVKYFTCAALLLMMVNIIRKLIEWGLIKVL